MSFLGGSPRDVTQTEAFRRWFGQSVVTNADGSPLIVYHGTLAPDEFSVFLPRKDEIGVHFGTQEQASDAVMEVFYYRERKGLLTPDLKPRIYPVYLSIQSPVALTDKGEWSAITVASQLVSTGIITQAELSTIKRLDTGHQILDRGVVDWGQQTAAIKAVIEAIERAGYDGIVYGNVYEGRDQDNSYIILRPTQAKSATGNRGTFDPNDPNVLHGYRRR